MGRIHPKKRDVEINRDLTGEGKKVVAVGGKASLDDSEKLSFQEEATLGPSLGDGGRAFISL